jgi:hypothetical protein
MITFLTAFALSQYDASPFWWAAFWLVIAFEIYKSLEK